MDKQVTVTVGVRIAARILDTLFDSVVAEFTRTIGDLEGFDIVCPSEAFENDEILDWFKMMTNGFSLDISVNYDHKTVYPSLKE